MFWKRKKKKRSEETIKESIQENFPEMKNRSFQTESTITIPRHKDEKRPYQVTFTYSY